LTWLAQLSCQRAFSPANPNGEPPNLGSVGRHFPLAQVRPGAFPLPLTLSAIHLSEQLFIVQNQSPFVKEIPRGFRILRPQSSGAPHGHSGLALPAFLHYSASKSHPRSETSLHGSYRHPSRSNRGHTVVMTGSPRNHVRSWFGEVSSSRIYPDPEVARGQPGEAVRMPDLDARERPSKSIGHR